MDSGDELGEEIHDHTVDTNGGLNGGDGIEEEDTHNGLIEGCGGLEGGIAEKERGTRSNLVEKDDGLDSSDTTGKELGNTQLQDQGEVAEDSGLSKSEFQ